MCVTRFHRQIKNKGYPRSQTITIFSFDLSMDSEYYLGMNAGKLLPEGR